MGSQQHRACCRRRQRLSTRLDSRASRTACVGASLACSSQLLPHALFPIALSCSPLVPLTALCPFLCTFPPLRLQFITLHSTADSAGIWRAPDVLAPLFQRCCRRLTTQPSPPPLPPAPPAALRCPPRWHGSAPAAAALAVSAGTLQTHKIAVATQVVSDAVFRNLRSERWSVHSGGRRRRQQQRSSRRLAKGEAAATGRWSSSSTGGGTCLRLAGMRCGTA